MDIFLSVFLDVGTTAGILVLGSLPISTAILLPCVVAGSLDRDAGDQPGLVAGTFWGWNTLLLPPFKKERVVSNTGTQAFDVQT